MFPGWPHLFLIDYLAKSRHEPVPRFRRLDDIVHVTRGRGVIGIVVFKAILVGDALAFRGGIGVVDYPGGKRFGESVEYCDFSLWNKG